MPVQVLAPTVLNVLIPIVLNVLSCSPLQIRGLLRQQDQAAGLHVPRGSKERERRSLLVSSEAVMLPLLVICGPGQSIDSSVRFPTPLTFNPEDPVHMDFIMAAANLKAQVMDSARLCCSFNG